MCYVSTHEILEGMQLSKLSLAGGVRVTSSGRSTKAGRCSIVAFSHRHPPAHFLSTESDDCSTDALSLVVDDGSVKPFYT